jgi:hypothetical protein
VTFGLHFETLARYIQHGSAVLPICQHENG